MFKPFYNSFMVSDDEAFRKIVKEIMSWDVKVIIPCHGDVVRGEDLCKRVLGEHFKKFI